LLTTIYQNKMSRNRPV